MVEKGKQEEIVGKVSKNHVMGRLHAHQQSLDSTFQVISGGVTKSVLTEDWKENKPKALRPAESLLTCSR